MWTAESRRKQHVQTSCWKVSAKTPTQDCSKLCLSWSTTGTASKHLLISVWDAQYLQLICFILQHEIIGVIVEINVSKKTWTRGVLLYQSNFYLSVNFHINRKLLQLRSAVVKSYFTSELWMFPEKKGPTSGFFFQLWISFRLVFLPAPDLCLKFKNSGNDYFSDEFFRTNFLEISELLGADKCTAICLRVEVWNNRIQQ